MIIMILADVEYAPIAQCPVVFGHHSALLLGTEGGATACVGLSLGRDKV
jgi:hypothetical protein